MQHAPELVIGADVAKLDASSGGGSGVSGKSDQSGRLHRTGLSRNVLFETPWAHGYVTRARSSARYPQGMHCVAEALSSDPEIRTAPPRCKNRSTARASRCWQKPMCSAVTSRRAPPSHRARRRFACSKAWASWCLHSGHYSKIFERLLGTSCSLTWRGRERERLWVCNPGHRIAQGLGSISIEMEQMYGELFGIPAGSL